MPFQTSLVRVRKTGAYQSGAPFRCQFDETLTLNLMAYPRLDHLKGASFGEAPALPANIRLGLKSSNALAY